MRSHAKLLTILQAWSRLQFLDEYLPTGLYEPILESLDAWKDWFKAEDAEKPLPLATPWEPVVRLLIAHVTSPKLASKIYAIALTRLLTLCELTNDDLSLINEIQLLKTHTLLVTRFGSSSQDLGLTISGSHSDSLSRIALGQGRSSKLRAKLLQGLENEQSILVENMHLEPDAMPVIRAHLQTLQTMNDAPLLALSTSASGTLPDILLRKTAKLALDAQSSIAASCKQYLQELPSVCDDSYLQEAGARDIVTRLCAMHAMLRSEVLPWSYASKFEDSHLKALLSGTCVFRAMSRTNITFHRKVDGCESYNAECQGALYQVTCLKQL